MTSLTFTSLLAGIITATLVEIIRIALRDALNPAPIRKQDEQQ